VGLDLACEQIDTIRESGAFDGVHLIPVARFREMASRLREIAGPDEGRRGGEGRFME
jgi:hypothetical protein